MRDLLNATLPIPIFIIMDDYGMSKKIVIELLFASLVLAAGILFAVRHRPKGPLAIGQSAPDFTLSSLAEKPISLHDYRRQVVVLNFWATWCPPCVQETPSLEKFSAEMRNHHVAVIGVSVDQDKGALEKFVGDYHLSFPIARDPDQALASRYGTSQFPETYILDREGNLAEKVIGAIDWGDPRMISFVQTLAGGPETP